MKRKAENIDDKLKQQTALPPRPLFPNEYLQQSTKKDTKWTNKVTKQNVEVQAKHNAKLVPNTVSEDDLPSAVFAHSIEEIKQILPDASLISPDEIKNIWDSDEKKYTKKISPEGTYITKDGVICRPLKPPSAFR
ncbi:MAG: hypothetical protein PQ612_04010 [Rickettsiales bacterium]|nr:hypothetical protein [Pseudomonadota bacterium]MDA0966221.1 hypothetical protein [Pseudomonadota bacterium]MDG4543114.1 hypothetical protein [Rickettsiales bacterium]MDG4545312.1 hypothetical protein [Rickettsiales bacterium]MDG4547761.1 hypothetical protein [Rickettsiales bacterium]